MNFAGDQNRSKDALQLTCCILFVVVGSRVVE